MGIIMAIKSNSTIFTILKVAYAFGIPFIRIKIGISRLCQEVSAKSATLLLP